VFRTGSEVCDDGNLVSGDGCDLNCTVTACGNGISTFATGEEVRRRQPGERRWLRCHLPPDGMWETVSPAIPSCATTATW
jgi:cysteine-rich repeat protein